MKPAELLDEAQAILKDTVELGRRIHRHPELGPMLPRTQATVLEALDDLGLDVGMRHRTTSVIARQRPPAASALAVAAEQPDAAERIRGAVGKHGAGRSARRHRAAA